MNIMTGRFIPEKECRYSINRSLVGPQRPSGCSGKDLNFLASTGTQTVNYQDSCLVTMPIILSPNTTSLDSELPQTSDSVYTISPLQNRPGSDVDHSPPQSDVDHFPPQSDVDHSPPPSFQVMSEWSYKSMPPLRLSDLKDSFSFII